MVVGKKYHVGDGNVGLEDELKAEHVLKCLGWNVEDHLDEEP